MNICIQTYDHDGRYCLQYQDYDRLIKNFASVTSSLEQTALYLLFVGNWCDFACAGISKSFSLTQIQESIDRPGPNLSGFSSS